MTQVLIIGASRGIGLEFARQYREAGCSVTATARSDEAQAALAALGCKAVKLDVNDIQQISGLGWQLEGASFDIAIISAGVYGPRTSGLDAPSQAQFDEVMHSNVLASMRLIPQLVPVLDKQAKLAVISSRMGSISERGNASGWLYRASKAALNSVLKDASLALGAQGITCVSLHPGWVRTEMGGSEADLTAEQSVNDMRHVISRLRHHDNGRFFNHNGSLISW